MLLTRAETLSTTRGPTEEVLALVVGVPAPFGVEASAVAPGAV